MGTESTAESPVWPQWAYPGSQSPHLFFAGLLALLLLAIAGHLSPFLLSDLSCIEKTEFHTLVEETYDHGLSFDSGDG